MLSNPAQTSVFVRTFPGHGLFVGLPTTYDSMAHELIATLTTFGEIVFGEPDVQQLASVPLLVQPVNGKRTLAGSPVVLQWTGRGLLSSFRLQIAADTLFTAPIVDTTQASSFHTAGGLLSNQSYYWCVLSTNSLGAGDWSAV